MGNRAGILNLRGRRATGALLAACIVLATSCGTASTRAAGPEPTSISTPLTTSRPGTPSTRPGSSLSATTAPAPTPTDSPDSAPKPAGPTSGGRLAVPSEAEARRLDIRTATLTTSNWTTYAYLTGTDTITAAMRPGVTDGNIREVFWLADAAPVVDDQSCITWEESSGSVDGEPIQPGLAMRIASVGSGNEGIRAITLTANVYLAGTWLFNVHVWDTRLAEPMTLLHTFDVSKVVGRVATVDGKVADFMADPPWHLCGRTDGDTFRFKVWTQDHPEPGWDDPDQSFGVQLPSGWTHAGYSGGYIGHLHPGQSATAIPQH